MGKSQIWKKLLKIKSAVVPAKPEAPKKAPAKAKPAPKPKKAPVKKAKNEDK